MTNIDEANQILDKVKLPTGEEDWFVLKYKDGKFVPNTSHPQQVYMGQELTKQVFGKTGKRFTVMPVQDSYDLMHSDEEYKRHGVEGWFHDGELFLESGLLIPEPQVRDVEGELKYILEAQMMASEGRLKPIKSDKAVEVKINKNDVIDTLVRAGRMKEPTHKVYRDSMSFDKEGLSSVRSFWDSVEVCFDADSYRPSGRYSNGRAAYKRMLSPQEKIDLQKIEIEKQINSEEAKIKEASAQLVKARETLKK